MRFRIIAWLLIVTVLFQHFELFQLGDFRVTVALFSGSILVALASKRLSPIRLTAVWAPILALTSLGAIFAAGISQPVNFFSTLALMLLATAIVVFATNGMKPGVFQSTAVWRAVHSTLIMVVLLSAFQVALGALGNDVLFNLFGGFQFQNQYNPQLGFVAFPRAQGLFLEPSYNAFVISSLAVALLCSGRYFRSTIALALLGLASAQSATGLIVFLLIVLMLSMRSRPKVAIPIGIAGLILLGFLGPSLIARLESIGDVGSSGNYRILAPIQVLQDLLQTNPLGLPLGSIYDVVGGYGLTMYGVAETASLDNGLYVIIYYFGWVGVILVSWMACWAVASVARARTHKSVSLEWIVPAWLLGSLLFSGGIVAPEFAVMTWLVVASYVEAKKTRNGSVDEQGGPATTERGNRDLPGHTRPAAHPDVVEEVGK